MIFDAIEADQYLESLSHEIQWKHDEIFIYGKHIVMDRKVAWYGDNALQYKYSGKNHIAMPWTVELLKIKKLVELKSETEFNSCLLIYYQDGDQGMGWHSDDEKSLDPYNAIASVSFGAKRRFDFRHKADKTTISIDLENGSLLLMAGDTQAKWKHQLPKSKKVTCPRINLTFRKILV